MDFELMDSAGQVVVLQWDESSRTYQQISVSEGEVPPLEEGLVPME
jgi:hypothetical protein